jgi:hypothetical protein
MTNPTNLKTRLVRERAIYGRINWHVKKHMPGHTFHKSGDDWYLLKGDEYLGCFTLEGLARHLRLMKPYEAITPDTFRK